tara:strand:+ start:171 stop:344 length:174 start_codon:yes stop_codon:yes gene_type:complete
MIFKQTDTAQYIYWEEVEDEDLWEDGELDSEQVKEKLYQEVIRQGVWRIIRNITKGE